jgi:hypothetical protein
MTFYCSACTMNWSPHQCEAGTCPTCGGGTKRRVGEPMSDDAGPCHLLASIERAYRERLDQFEAYYAERELTRLTAPLRAPAG